jgi:hypothetical protein
MQPRKAVTYLFSEFKFNLHIPTKRVVGKPVYEIKINLYLKLLSRAAALPARTHNVYFQYNWWRLRCVIWRYNDICTCQRFSLQDGLCSVITCHCVLTIQVWFHASGHCDEVSCQGESGDPLLTRVSCLPVLVGSLRSLPFPETVIKILHRTKMVQVCFG